MILNLINDAWIPVKRQNNEKTTICPSQITDLWDLNPFVSFDAPRADFNGALIQFLIGLIQTTFAPKDAREWRKYFSTPPTSKELQEKFKQYAYAFNLGGDGARFMQDLTLESEIFAKYQDLEKTKIEKKLAEEFWLVEELFIDNEGYFNKQGRIDALCTKCAAIALFTLQLNAPSGGSGHRTSLRGGGPLTTLVLGNNLWQTVWLNILDEDKFLDIYKTKNKIEEFTDKDIFPWLTNTRTSEEDQQITCQDVHPSQVFWATPLRIHFDFNNVQEGFCSIDQSFSKQLIFRYFKKNYGNNYVNWQHPLTPHYLSKEGMHMPTHGQPGGISYRHWLGLVQNDEESNKFYARTVKEFLQKQEQKYKVLQDYRFRLWVFGYDMDNMKPRAWVESIMPVIIFEDSEKYEEIINQLIKAAEKVKEKTKSCIKKALFKRTDEIKGSLSFIDAEFWQNTETDFYAILEEFRQATPDINEIKINWLNILKKSSNLIFDKTSQNSEIENVDPKRIALAHHELNKFNNSNSILQLLDLVTNKKTKKG